MTIQMLAAIAILKLLYIFIAFLDYGAWAYRQKMKRARQHISCKMIVTRSQLHLPAKLYRMYRAWRDAERRIDEGPAFSRKRKMISFSFFFTFDDASDTMSMLSSRSLLLLTPPPSNSRSLLAFSFSGRPACPRDYPATLCVGRRAAPPHTRRSVYLSSP